MVIIGGMAGRGLWAGFALTCTLVASSAAQTPKPFPSPGDAKKPQPTSPEPPAKAPPAQTRPATSERSDEPTEQTLGLPLYPGSQFITSYDAGRGQRYYLFGSTASFAELVAYYRTMLKQRGELTFEAPPIHTFDVGRFREETMVFPPGVTVKDYTWGGSEGYINPKRGVQPTHFRTIVQIVPAPPGATGR